MCDVESRAVLDWAVRGRIQHFRTPGQHLRFHVADVAEFLAGEFTERRRSAGSTRQANVQQVIALCSRTRQSLRRQLRGLACLWPDDALSALILLGQTGASALIVERSALGKIQPVAFIDAVLEEAPGTRLIWFGSVPRGKREQLVVVDDPAEVKAALA